MASRKSHGETAEDLLIDLSDEITIPFPSELLTAEVDDTFGLFGKARSQSAPVVLDRMTASGGVDVFSPVFDPWRSNNDNVNDQVFRDEENFMVSVTPLASRTSSKATRTKECAESQPSQVLAGSAISRLTLNDAFLASNSEFSLELSGSTNETRSSFGRKSISFTSDTPVSATSNQTTESDSSTGISSITNNMLDDEARLADLDEYCQSVGGLLKASKKTAQAAIEARVDDVIAKILDKRKSNARKPVNDDISRQIQEMFDAASPTKNPNIYKEGYVKPRRSFTPARQTPSYAHEPFSYATPRRQSVLPTPAGLKSSGTSVTPIIRPANATATLVETVQTEKVIVAANGIALGSQPCSSMKTPTPLKEYNRTNLKTPVRLKFSSSSSCSVDSDESLKLNTNLDKPLNQPIIPAIKPIGYSLPRIRQPHQAKSVQLQPMKAIHVASSQKRKDQVDAMEVPKVHVPASAPVHRKFATPVAASSPICTPPRNQGATARVGIGSDYGRNVKGIKPNSNILSSRIKPINATNSQHMANAPTSSAVTQQINRAIVKRRSYSTGDSYIKPQGKVHSAGQLPKRPSFKAAASNQKR